MATTAQASQALERGQLGLFGVIMPAVAQVAPAFNLFFTTGVMVALAGASAPRPPCWKATRALPKDDPLALPAP